MMVLVVTPLTKDEQGRPNAPQCAQELYLYRGLVLYPYL